ncbi:MAG: hypothetical protein M1429_04195 [Patescibacteria group bacterium]|nr:hypothetical protein [Patescibacteria group bacterium]
MAIIQLDTKNQKTYAVFNIPKGYRYNLDELTHLKGRIILSSKPDVMIGDGICVISGAMKFVLDNMAEGNSVFEVDVVESNRRQTEDDPYWFCPKVTLPLVVSTDNAEIRASVRAKLEVIEQQARSARELI